MFSERALPPEVEGVREAYAPGAVVFDCARDFETLPVEHRDDLALFVDDIHPHEYDEAWLPGDAPALLRRLVERELVVGMPGDGSVAWTTQTTPPVVLVKPRVEGSPEAFVDFLVAEALVEAGLGLPEQFLGLFREEYPAFAAAVNADPATTYQLAAACCDAYRGLHTREEFASWDDEFPRLHDAWADAGERLRERVAGLPSAVARGETEFADATELACGAVKHDVDVPAPWAPLDSVAYREYGASYAVKWAEKLFE